MELLVAEREGYPLPIAAQLGHLGGPTRSGTLHAQSFAAAVGGEDRSSIGGVLRRWADIVVLVADATDLEAIVVAHAWLVMRLLRSSNRVQGIPYLAWWIFAIIYLQAQQKTGSASKVAIARKE